MKYTSEVNISRKDFDRINRLLNDVDFNYEDKKEMQSIIAELDARKDTMPYGFCFDFDNGSKIYIDICSGGSNYYDNCQWVSSDCKADYLFDCDYSIEEKMEFHPTDNGDVYICKFKIEEE